MLHKPMHKDLRQWQTTLDGVTLTTVSAISLGAGQSIPGGKDVTEEARYWPNLPTLLKRGTVRAEPPVDWTRLEMPTRPQHAPAAPQAPQDQPKEQPKGKHRRG